MGYVDVFDGKKSIIGFYVAGVFSISQFSGEKVRYSAKKSLPFSRYSLKINGLALSSPAVQEKALKERNVNHIGFFTHPDSPKHIFLYQKFVFWPRFLTAIMSMPVESNFLSSSITYYSDLSDDEKYVALNACRKMTHSIFEGLDLSREISAADIHVLGETLLLWDNSKLAGFAVCHCGAGTEAGSETCYVKFGAVRSGSNAAKNFDLLLVYG